MEVLNSSSVHGDKANDKAIRFPITTADLLGQKAHIMQAAQKTLTFIFRIESITRSAGTDANISIITQKSLLYKDKKTSPLKSKKDISTKK